MIAIVLMIVGAVVGGTLAKRRKGNGLDIAQYAGVYAIIGGILGMFITIALERLL